MSMRTRKRKTIVPTRHQVTESREAEKPKAAAVAQQGTEPGSFVSQYGMITTHVQSKVVDRLKLVYILMSASFGLGKTFDYKYRKFPF
jgi:hypothetical protein